MSLMFVLKFCSVVLAKHRMQRVPVRVYLRDPYPEGAKEEEDGVPIFMKRHNEYGYTALIIAPKGLSLTVHVAHADNVLRGLSAAADGVEAASPSAGRPSLATALFTRAMGRKRPRASSDKAPLVAFTCCILGVA
jgi:hypothetical protein